MIFDHIKGLKLINANILKMMAMGFMLIDHMWATIIPGNQWMNYLGRLAFPIFAFQITEGFKYTKNFKNYARRLLLLAIISEVPFNLFFSSSVIYPFYQNTIFTLLLGLLAIKAIDNFKVNASWRTLVVALLSVSGTTLAAIIGMTDYGATGVLTIVAFYLFRDFPLAWIFQLGSMVILHMIFYSGLYIPLEFMGINFDFQTQGFAVLALIPIWLYNGQKGSKKTIYQYSFYVFYPFHLLILYYIFTMI